MPKSRNRTKQTRPLEERMAEQAAKLRQEAATMSAGPEREALLKRIRLAEVGSRISGWLSSPGLQTPD